MPRVAQFEQQTTSTVTRGARAGSVATGAFGGPAAQGLGDLGQGLREMQQRVDTTAAEEAILGFEREKNDILFNADTGYFNTQGRNAHDQAGTANDAIAALKETYSGTLESDAAKQAFGRAADAHITSASRDISRHSFKGMQAWEVATQQAQVENSVENAALYWNDSQAMSVQMALGEQALHDAMDLRGITGEARNEQLQTFRSSFGMSAIESALTHTYTDGKNTFDKVESQLEGPDLIRARKMLEQKKKASETQSIAATASAAALFASTNFDTLPEMNQYIMDNVKDPRANKAALAETKQRFDLEQYATRTQQDAFFTDAEEQIANGSTGEAWKFENPDAYEQLSTAQQKAIDTGALTVTDPNVWADVSAMPLSELKTQNVNDYSQSLAIPERKILAQRIQDAREGKFDVNVQTQAQEINAAVESLIGQKKSKWSTSQTEKAAVFNLALEAELQQQTDVKGRQLTRDEVRDIIGSAASTVVKEGFFVDTETDVTDIPGEEFIQAREDLIRRGRVNPTTQDVVQWWIKGNR